MYVLIAYYRINDLIHIQDITTVNYELIDNWKIVN